MRHAYIATTRKSYIKTLPEQTISAMERLETAIGQVSTLVQ
jgi:hypothetical protein